MNQHRNLLLLPLRLILSVGVSLSLPILVLGTTPAGIQSETPVAKLVGIELDGLGDGGRARPFVDLARTLRPWTKPSSSDAAPVDPNGWPTSDATTVLFDIRPAFAWAPPIDDPNAFQPDWSGRYPFSFQGQATIQITEGPGCHIENVQYDPARNQTTGQFLVEKNSGILVVSFTGSRRTPESPVGSGFTALRVIRPGYFLESEDIFTREFIQSRQPFAVLRYMDWLDTNHQPGFYGDAGHHALEWSARRRADAATQVSTGETYGVAWEYIVALANQTHKNLWINIPVAATDAYVQALAEFLKDTLDPDLAIYIEHSNEVWNFGFPQYTYNKLAAIEEVKRGGSPLNADSTTDEETWARRRHAKRVVEIGKTFRAAFGVNGISRIRPIYASWVIFPGPYYDEVLDWVSKTYGPAKDQFYGVAGAAYFNIEKASETATPEQLIDAMRTSSDDNLKFRTEIQAVALKHGLKHCQYEVGPDVGGGKTINVGNRIQANRHPRMRELLLHDARDNWFDKGGDLYMIFSHCSTYSRYGAWGLSDDIHNLTTPKWLAVQEITGIKP